MKKRGIIIILVIIVLLVSVGLYYYFANSSKEETNFTVVTKGDISQTIEETGEICSKKVNAFYSDVSKKVAILNVSIGDKVKKDDILLVYDNNFDLEIQRLNKQLDALTASYNEATKGVDFEQVSTTKLTINSIETNLELAKSNYDKSKILFNQNVISRAEYEKIENEVKLLENQLNIAYNDYDLMTKDISDNIKRQYEAQIDEVVLGIQLLEKAKEDNYIKASFDGIVTELNANEGSMTKYGTTIIEIQDNSDLCINADLLVDDAVIIEDNMKVIIQDDSKVWSNTSGDLKINKIYPKAFSKISELGIEQKRIRIEIGIPKSYGELLIGTKVDIEIIVDEKSDALLLGKDAIYQKEGKDFVTVLENNNEKEVEIITGIEDDEFVEIIDGLKENDKVVVE